MFCQIINSYHNVVLNMFSSFTN